MSEPRITSVHSVDLGVSDLDAATRFFTDVWRLDITQQADGSAWLRGTGPDRYIIGLHARPKAELIRVNLTADDKGAVDAIHAKAKAYGGLGLVEGPAALSGPGGGYGFAFKDVEGRNIAVATGIAAHPDTADVDDRPRKLSHVVLNSDQPDKTQAQFIDLLGFRLSDKTRMLTFFRCNADHHSIAVANGGGPTLHHMAFEVPDWESVMRGAGRCRDNDTPIEWGVGRHGPGNNVFAYFLGPEGIPIEYTAEVQQVDDSYPTGGPDDWGFAEGRTDHWGVTDPPSKRMAAAHGKVGFAEGLGLGALQHA